MTFAAPEPAVALHRHRHEEDAFCWAGGSARRASQRRRPARPARSSRCPGAARAGSSRTASATRARRTSRCRPPAARQKSPSAIATSSATNIESRTGRTSRKPGRCVTSSHGSVTERWPCTLEPRAELAHHADDAEQRDNPPERPPAAELFAEKEAAKSASATDAEVGAALALARDERVRGRQRPAEAREGRVRPAPPGSGDRPGSGPAARSPATGSR